MTVDSHKFRRLARDWIAKGLSRSGVISAQQRHRASERQVCVLGLHRVLDRETRQRASSHRAMIMDEKCFEGMLGYLASYYDVLSLEDFLAGSRSRTDRPAVLLTFDDGWADNYTTAFPILEKIGMPATIFLATDLVGSRNTFWIETLLRGCKSENARQRIFSSAQEQGLPHSSPEELVEHLKRMPTRKRDDLLKNLAGDLDRDPGGDAMLSWEQVKEMAANGITFGSHTASHPLLTYEDDERVRQELSSSREALERHLGVRPRVLAYPNGDYDQRAREYARTAGYECAFTTERRWHVRGDDGWAVPRFLIHDGSLVDSDGDFSPEAFEFTLTGWR